MDSATKIARLLNRLATVFPQLRGTGLDLSSQMLIARRSNRHRPRLLYIQGKAESLPFAPGQFDAVFNTLSFLHYLQAEQVFSEVERVLRPNGRFYLVDPTSKSQTEPEWIAVSPGGIKLYSPKSRELLGSSVGLRCVGHYYLLGPVLLTIFAKQSLM